MVFPCVPQTSEGKGLAVAHAEGEGLFRLGIQLLPLKKAVGGDEAAVALLVICSARALIVEKPLKASRFFAKNGINPQRISTSSRSPVSFSLRITGWKVLGATL